MPPSFPVTVTCSSTQYGEQVAIVGSWNNWDKARFTALQTTPQTFPKWKGTLTVPGLESFEYKYVVVRNGKILRWEPAQGNRTGNPAKSALADVFGRIASDKKAVKNAIDYSQKQEPRPLPPLPANLELDELEKAVIEVTSRHKSWRQRLSFVRSLFTDPPEYFASTDIDHLATVAIYLTFLSTNQVPCHEDGGHHRPNYHASEARQIEKALSSVLGQKHEGKAVYIPYVVRKIFPHLPSYSSQFTVSVPLTRIRDIAHRGDIPRDLKQEIKHTLQNKLHRCAGPEDLQTSERILQRISHGGYSQPFVDQFRIFHAELREFFNASSLDDRLNYLQKYASVAKLAAELANLKMVRAPALLQMDVVGKLREEIARLPFMTMDNDDELPSEDVQKTRLTDIDLEGYAFLLMAGVAKDAEQQNVSSFNWFNALRGLGLTLDNVGLSGICVEEARATAAEIHAVKSCSDKFRIRAAVERALRFAESFSSAISDVYVRRVTSLGTALGVDKHAISVFAEAEIRSNLTFQASRIADRCAHVCRKELNLPPWDPLYAGMAEGKVLFKNTLADVSEHDDTVVVVCRTAEGDEDIPPNVRGVVLGRSLPHLSHLGVRARQAGVVFVCAEDRDVFEDLWKRRNVKTVSLVVNATEGLSSFSPISGTNFPTSNQQRAEGDRVDHFKKVDIKFDGSAKKPLLMGEVTKQNSSSKSSFAAKLHALAKESNGLFDAPPGIAIPHGVFQAQRAKHAKQYNAMITKYSNAYTAQHNDADEQTQLLHQFVKSKFVLEEGMCRHIQNSFPPNARVMVRSSANAEDLEEMSGAGLYDSFANVPVHSTSVLQAATSAVWASLWTKRAASSRAAYRVAHKDVSMAVLVQEMIRADMSFVGFSRDPVSKSGRGDLYVELAVGMGETLASATSAGSPYRFRIDRKTFQVEVITLASYSEALVPDFESAVLLRSTVDYSQELMTTDTRFRVDLVQRIAETVLLLEERFGGPQDVEGAVTVADGNVQVFVVQARPQILSK